MEGFVKTDRKPTFPTGYVLPGEATITRPYLCMGELEVYDTNLEGEKCTAFLWRFTSDVQARIISDLQTGWWERLGLKYRTIQFSLGRYTYSYGLLNIPGKPLEIFLHNRKSAILPVDCILGLTTSLCMAGQKGMEAGLECCMHPLLVWVDPDRGKAIPPIIGADISGPAGVRSFYRHLIPFLSDKEEKNLCFALGCFLYRLLSRSRVDFERKNLVDMINNLEFLSWANKEVDDDIVNIVQLCLSSFDSSEPVRLAQIKESLSLLQSSRRSCVPKNHDKHGVSQVKATRKGLAGVAGMEQLKEKLRLEVINPFRDPKKYEWFGLSIPSGILFFGPPGCGKTHIARQLAEELNFHYQEVIPSTIASSYIHGATIHISQTFQKAEKKSPSVIFIDEIDALMPSRGGMMDFQQYKSEEVSEFLIRLSNCADKNILVIGASNEPHKIDPAILRPGRFDRLIYVGPPDEKSRSALLRFYLERRPVVAGFDSFNLAMKLVNYSSADIRLLVDEAARQALKADAKLITELHFAKALKKVPPGIDPQMLLQYRRFQARG